MVKRHVLAFAEGQAKELVRGEKRGLDHFVEWQIGFDFGFIEVEFRLAALFGIVAPIPWRDVARPPRSPARPPLRAAPARGLAPTPNAKSLAPLAAFSPSYRPGGSARNFPNREAARAPCATALSMARLSVNPPDSPRCAQARNAFSRRSRRVENCRKGAMLERDKVMPCLPGRPQSAAVRAAAETSDAGRPARSSVAARTSTSALSSARTF